MYDPNLVQSLINSQSEKIEQAREQVKALMSLLDNSTISLQMSKEDIDTVVVSSVLADKKTFRQEIMSKAGCDLKTYFVSLKKFTLRQGLEAADIDLTSAKREILTEELCSKDESKVQDLLDYIKECSV